jgi:hypothetical protein
VHDIFTTFRQRGLIRIEDHGDSRNFKLFMRPALPMVVAEDTIASLEEFVNKTRAGQDASSGNQSESGEAA